MKGQMGKVTSIFLALIFLYSLSLVVAGCGSGGGTTAGGGTADLIKLNTSIRIYVSHPSEICINFKNEFSLEGASASAPRCEQDATGRIVKITAEVTCKNGKVTCIISGISYDEMGRIISYHESRTYEPGSSYEINVNISYVSGGGFYVNSVNINGVDFPRSYDWDNGPSGYSGYSMLLGFSFYDPMSPFFVPYVVLVQPD